MQVVREIKEAGEGSANFYAAYIASLDEVREFAPTILDEYDRLDVLIHVARLGFLRANGERARTATPSRTSSTARFGAASTSIGWSRHKRMRRQTTKRRGLG